MTIFKYSLSIVIISSIALSCLENHSSAGGWLLGFIINVVGLSCFAILLAGITMKIRETYTAYPGRSRVDATFSLIGDFGGFIALLLGFLWKLFKALPIILFMYLVIRYVILRV